LEFRIVANQTDDKDVIKAGLRTPGRDVYIGGRKVGQWVKAGSDLPQKLPPPAATYRPSSDGSVEILARIDPFNVDGRYLARAGQGTDEKGSRAVDFSFNAAGAERFRQLTNRNLPDEATNFYRHLGIVLDNTMLSAPQIRSAIGAHGQITGDFTEDEVNFLVGVLNAGSLPATLRPEPISQQRISAQLGDDTIRAGMNAMIISTAAVLLFMFVYYRFAGLVADLAVSLNVVATVAVMILIKAAFTLPGLAGLVLTVGMAVDANVLIYERMREELERGASLRMAIRNGFSRAMSTIIDSHVTTLCSGVVLFIVGTDQIKGFAVTLIIGLLLSLFTAVFVAHVIFDIVERKGWIKRLTMMRLIRPTNFDFIGWCRPVIVCSVLVCVIGLAAVWSRGKELLDIDFTGGSSVHVAFIQGKEPSIGAMREAVAGLPDVAVSSVGEGGLEYKVDTSDNNIAHVKAALQKTFGDRLETYSMNVGELAVIEPEAEKGSGGDASGPAAGETRPAGDGDVKAPPSTEGETKGAGDSSTSAEPGKPAEENPQPAEPARPEAEKSPGAGLAIPRRVEVASASDSLAMAALLQEESEPAGGTSSAPAAAEQAGPETKPSEPAADAGAQPADKPAAGAPAAEPDKAPPDKPAEEPAAPAEGVGESEASIGSLIGGTRAELTFSQPIAHEALRELIQQKLTALKESEAVFRLSNPSYQTGSEKPYEKWTLEMSLKKEQARTLLESIQKQLASTPVFPSSSEIGGKVALDTQLMALYAILASLLMIVVYIWVRFQNVIFGLAAVLALVHDVMVTIAFLAASYYVSPYLGFLMVDPFKISLAVMAALLTIIGFSINDKIVVFDRIREVRGKSPDLTAEMINLSANQTLSRTLLTGGAVIISCIILYVVGGAGIHGFSFAMLVGVIAGTYSSIYIAAPALLWMHRPPARAAAASTAAMPTAAAGK
jgi:SecD/SecF fusion protein